MDAASSPVRIPVAVVTVGAYRFVFGRLGLFLELAWLPLLLLLAVAIMPAWLPWLVAPRIRQRRAPPAAGCRPIGDGGAVSQRLRRALAPDDAVSGAAGAASVSWFRSWLWFLLYTLAFYLANLAMFALVFLLAGGEDTNQWARS